MGFFYFMVKMDEKTVSCGGLVTFKALIYELNLCFSESMRFFFVKFLIIFHLCKEHELIRPFEAVFIKKVIGCP